jgi:hypothetical protein
MTGALPCMVCGTVAPPRVAPGRGPHAAAAVCSACGHWLRWLPKRRRWVCIPVSTASRWWARWAPTA